MYTACNDNKEIVVFDNSKNEGAKDKTRIPSDIRKGRMECAVMVDDEGESLPRRVTRAEHSMLIAGDIFPPPILADGNRFSPPLVSSAQIMFANMSVAFPNSVECRKRFCSAINMQNPNNY